MNQPATIDNDVDGIQSVGQAAETVVKKVGQALAERVEAPVEIANAESTAIFQIIERAARDPNVDIDKMERLLLMQERVLSRNAKAAFSAAMAEMQPKLPVVDRKGKNTNTKQAYAKWEDIAEAIAPIIAAHGFSLTFKVKRVDTAVSITGVLMHDQGHSEDTTLDLPVDTGAGRNAVQAVGSSVSYGKRYVAGLLLNFVSRDIPDDDGNGTDTAERINPAQLKRLQGLIAETNSDTVKFCAVNKIEALPDMLATDFDNAVRLLEQKKAALKEKAA